MNYDIIYYQTSVMKSFMLEDFNHEEVSTVGVSPVEYYIGLTKLRMWDMSGMVMHSSTTLLRSKYINACVFICDATSYKSFNWLKVILDTHVIEEWTYALLLLNKGDLVDEEEGNPDQREVYEEDIEDLCDVYGLDAAIEVSALTSSRIHEAIADAILKGDQLKYLAPKKKTGLSIHHSDELDAGYQFRTLHMFPMCVPNNDENEYS